ncbi:hypothetical protein EBR77_04015 [bacterium]|nr:hypothetical protein [bacterium]NBX78761.1 hypothetical protein [bacterium]
MDQAQALVLKIIDPVEPKLLLLHEKYGKVVAYTKKHPFFVCPGMLIVCVMKQKRDTWYVEQYEQVALPVLHAQEQLYQLHHLLHTVDVLVPFHATLDGMCEAMLHVYEPGRVLSEKQFQFFFLKICLAAGVFPEDPHLYSLVLSVQSQIHTLTFSPEQEQKIHAAFVWCTEYVHSRKK